MKTLTNTVWYIAICLSLLTFCVVIVKKQTARMHQYAIEHNCRWDYNDMCYTESERPWLFK